MAINRHNGSYGNVKPKPFRQYLKQWFCKHDLKLVGHRKGLSYSRERYPACVRLHNGDIACWHDHNQIEIYECSKCGAKVEKVISKETKVSISSS